MSSIEAAGLTTPLIALISEFDVKCEPTAEVGDRGDIPAMSSTRGRESGNGNGQGKKFRSVASGPGETEQLQPSRGHSIFVATKSNQTITSDSPDYYVSRI